MGQWRLLTWKEGVVMLPGLQVHPQLGLLGLRGCLLASPSSTGCAAGSGVVFLLWRLHSESLLRDLPALLDLGIQRLVGGLVGGVVVSPVTQGRVTFVS